MFGQNIKELRIEKGLSQKELAEKIGVSQGAIFFWEKEINEPTAGCLLSLSKVFGVSVDDILSAEYKGKKELDNKTAEICEYFPKLNKSQQEILIKLAKEMIGF